MRSMVSGWVTNPTTRMVLSSGGWAMGGMTPGEVLRAATIDGARIIGLAQDLGSIEPGKLADLVVLDENPLDDIRHTTSIRYVVKNGEVFEGDTLDQIWPVEKPIEPFWSWSDPVEQASHEGQAAR